MSDAQTVWLILWDRAARDPAPFEISEVAPEVAKRLGLATTQAERKIAGLLKELARMPEGEQYFTQEGYAVVTLPEFLAAPKDAETAKSAYPFEV